MRNGPFYNTSKLANAERDANTGQEQEERGRDKSSEVNFPEKRGRQRKADDGGGHLERDGNFVNT